MIACRMWASNRKERADLHSHKPLAMPMDISIVVLRIAVAAWLVWVSGCANAQAASSPSPSERSEPHEALAFYEGTWTIPDPKHKDYRETCSWLAEGRRHIVCRSRVETANGPRESLGIYSYDETSEEYAYHGFRAGGGILIERGQRIPNGFRFTSDRGTGAERVRTRFTIEEAAGGLVSTMNETAKAEGPWVVDEKLDYLRTRP